MDAFNNLNTIKILQRTLNYVDHRLMDHGKRVSYIVFKMLKIKGGFMPKEIRDICLLVLLHDVGAYKTDEIDDLVAFDRDAKSLWLHAIYGSLFIKNCSPLSRFAPAVLLHHGNAMDYADFSDYLQELAQMIHIADRADVFLRGSADGKRLFANYLKNNTQHKFSAEIVSLFLQLNLSLSDLDFANPDNDFIEFLAALETPKFTESEKQEYLKMFVYAIDFRSAVTVTHTVTTTAISKYVAEAFGVAGEEIKQVVQGALMHDLGKVGIPVAILEGGKLNAKEMAIMRTHVELTAAILDGNVSDEVWKIAVYHHEKLDGSGYPYGLKAVDLTLNQRIVAVADIVSALLGSRSYKRPYTKEETLKIIREMAENGLLDCDIVSLICEDFDEIAAEILRVCTPVVQLYNSMTEEYIRQVEKYVGLKLQKPFDLACGH